MRIWPKQMIRRKALNLHSLPLNQSTQGTRVAFWICFINRSCDQKGWHDDFHKSHRWQADTTVMTHELTTQIYNEEKEEAQRDRNLCWNIKSNPTQKERRGKENTRDKAMDNNSKMKTAFGARIFQIHNGFAESCIIKTLKLVLSLVQYQPRGRASWLLFFSAWPAEIIRQLNSSPDAGFR